MAGMIEAPVTPTQLAASQLIRRLRLPVVLAPMFLVTGPRSVVAGSVSDGAALQAVRLLGADAAYMGTRFIASEESDAVDEYRQLVVSSSADEIVLTSEVSGLNANWLRGSLDKLGYRGEKTGRLEGFSADDNFKAWKDIWGAGHGVGAVKGIQSIAEVVAELETGYRRTNV